MQVFFFFLAWFCLLDKPPIEELHQFLEFQLPRQWAPVFSDLPLGPQRRQQSTASLQFSFLGPKLYVNTAPVKLYDTTMGLLFFHCIYHFMLRLLLIRNCPSAYLFVFSSIIWAFANSRKILNISVHVFFMYIRRGLSSILISHLGDFLWVYKFRWYCQTSIFAFILFALLD